MADCPSFMQCSANLEGKVIQSQKHWATMLFAFMFLIYLPLEQAEEGVIYVGISERITLFVSCNS